METNQPAFPFPARTKEQQAATQAAFQAARDAERAAYDTQGKTTLRQYTDAQPVFDFDNNPTPEALAYDEAWSDLSWTIETEYGFQALAWTKDAEDGLVEAWGWDATGDNEVFLGVFPADSVVWFE